MKNRSANNISAEVLAAFIDGTATAQEYNEVVEAITDDAQLREILHISQLVDADLGVLPQQSDLLPMAAMAASCEEANYCSLECEKYILNNFDIDFDEQLMLQDAIHNGWQRECGTALHNIGRHLEGKGLVVTRQYNATISDIANALSDNMGVIVAVDGGELLDNNNAKEIVEDILIGQLPDHAVVVLSVDIERQIITLYDPNSPNAEDSYSIEQFQDAWNDAKNYLVTVTQNNMKTYIPKPIDLSDVELTDDLIDLREAIAENAHEVWAAERLAQGWSYGPQRDDAKKENPCMVPYSQLPDSEKTFDRNMAMDTIRLLKKLGYDIIKREDKHNILK